MGPYPRTRSGFTHIFTLENAFTRWLEAYPLRNTKTKDLIHQIEAHFFPQFRYPCVIRSDNGPQFRKAWNKYCGEHGIIPEKIAIYHPQANPVERQNQNGKIKT